MRYQYSGYWIETFLVQEGENFLYYASIELPNQGGVVDTQNFEGEDECQFQAEEIIEAWN